MSKHPCIQCRVPVEVKALLRAVAVREGVTESALIKRMLVPILRAAELAGLQSGADQTAGEGGRAGRLDREMRLYVRLDASDRLLLKERAGSHGVPSATYAAALLRAHLRTVAPLLKDERAALDRVVSVLTSVCRVLKQNRREKCGATQEELQAMLKVCAATRDHVKALVVANARIWSQGHGDRAQ